MRGSCRFADLSPCPCGNRPRTIRHLELTPSVLSAPCGLRSRLVPSFSIARPQRRYVQLIQSSPPLARLCWVCMHTHPDDAGPVAAHPPPNPSTSNHRRPHSVSSPYPVNVFLGPEGTGEYHSRSAIININKIIFPQTSHPIPSTHATLPHFCAPPSWNGTKLYERGVKTYSDRSWEWARRPGRRCGGGWAGRRRARRGPGRR